MKTNEIKPDEEDSFAEEFAIKWERQVRLESDKSVSGGLAFRLAGSKTHGVFVQYVNQKSKQSEILYKGDRILEVNGVDVRRWTCDQIANILRLVVQNKGYVLLQVGVSRQLHNRKGVIYEITKDANSNLQYCYPSRDLTYSYNSSLPASTSDTTDLSQQKICEKTGTCTVHYRQKVSSRKSMHFSCYNQNDEQQYSYCHQQKRNLIETAQSSKYGTQSRYDDEFDCVQYSQYFSKKHWHALKHRWVTNAMKLLPKSASEFFGLHIYHKAYYNLI